jgi:hydroxymethylpyrimidine pyrophosphatase-like HAD family hydrolase
MLAWAGLGVAVANAEETALAAAYVVTVSNDEDGVALVLERLAAGDDQPIRSASVGA